MADTEDLKSSAGKPACGFDSHPRHQLLREDMLTISGFVDGKPFSRDWTVGEGIPNILVDDVLEIKASGNELDFVNKIEGTENEGEELCFTNKYAKELWSLILKQKIENDVGPQGELSIDLQCYAQGHDEVDVRKIWLAWKRARDYAFTLQAKINKITKVVNDEACNEG